MKSIRLSFYGYWLMLLLIFLLAQFDANTVSLVLYVVAFMLINMVQVMISIVKRRTTELTIYLLADLALLSVFIYIFIMILNGHW